MGMYTELVLACEVEDNYQDCIRPIECLLMNRIDCTYPDHEFFKSPRSKYMLNSDSYYFDGETHSNLKYDIQVESYYLTIRCNLKNYDNEIEKFLNWLAPYILSYGFLGYYRYEEHENPTLIYIDKFHNHKITYKGVS